MSTAVSLHLLFTRDNSLKIVPSFEKIPADTLLCIEAELSIDGQTVKDIEAVIVAPEHPEAPLTIFCPSRHSEPYTKLIEVGLGAGRYAEEFRDFRDPEALNRCLPWQGDANDFGVLVLKFFLLFKNKFDPLTVTC